MMVKRSVLMAKNRERLYFLVFLAGLNTLFLFIRILTLFHFLIPRVRNKRDIILFPYAAEGSDGHTRRFVEYLPFLDQAGISYELCNLQSDQEMRQRLSGKWSRYALYLSILRKRTAQVLKARNYRIAFVQRGLFAMYFDLKTPVLEALLRKLNHQIVIDFWDAVYVKQPVLVRRTVGYADLVTVSNDYIRTYFNRLTPHVERFNIGVNTQHYKPKTSWQTGQEIRIIWTGLFYNLIHLRRHLPVLREIHKTTPLKLVVVCSEELTDEVIPVENYRWNADTFFDLLHQADIGIYPEEDSEISKGKSTMKVMDFLATGLPMIGVPYGLPDEAEHLHNMLIVRTPEDWYDAFTRLITQEELRAILGQNGLKLIREKYTVSASFTQFQTNVLNRFRS